MAKREDKLLTWFGENRSAVLLSEFECKQKFPWPCNDGGWSYLSSRMLGVEGVTICHWNSLKKTEFDTVVSVRKRSPRMLPNCVQVKEWWRLFEGLWWFVLKNLLCQKMQSVKARIFCLWLQSLGFKCPEEMLYIICLRSANGIVTWFSSKCPICYFANYA